jgi:hypothetical protein
MKKFRLGWSRCSENYPAIEPMQLRNFCRPCRQCKPLSVGETGAGGLLKGVLGQLPGQVSWAWLCAVVV